MLFDAGFNFSAVRFRAEKARYTWPRLIKAQRKDLTRFDQNSYYLLGIFLPITVKMKVCIYY
ncbi:hypothetical protein FC96_GL001205 [Secundilactobacillus kimchicus JCM 15530]|uniref:Uncharacterized protein n=1 Tax=Secundilactobacillus kimchicus JCM 15530 TaxID=1302272 RepID=A0A0R1HY95_9LACO|nr:hypothetical protein FC96_GL001205 [Secundilactobacillus kimchicus JCM 15530]